MTITEIAIKRPTLVVVLFSFLSWFNDEKRIFNLKLIEFLKLFSSKVIILNIKSKKISIFDIKQKITYIIKFNNRNNEKFTLFTIYLNNV